MYIRTHQELYDSVVEFYESAEDWRKVVGNAPRYFVHIKKNRNHYFAMSKFCVLKDITTQEYLDIYRNRTEGNRSQLIISNRLQEEWVSHAVIKPTIRKAFDKWIGEFFPNYNVDNANFISIEKKKSFKLKEREVTPEELQKQLELQKEIGDIGESIVINFELNRLRGEGFANPKKYIKHVAKFSVSAGFDILTSTNNEDRYIEVKSTISNKNSFFISEKEVKTLEKLKERSYIYFVQITDLKLKKGFVKTIMQNPIKNLREQDLLKPVAFKVNLSN